MEPPRCECHDEPKYWNVNRRGANGGYWLCAVRVRERKRATYRANAEQRRAQITAYYHDTGWLVRRRRDLAKQRKQILEQLAQLDQEAKAC